MKGSSARSGKQQSDVATQLELANSLRQHSALECLRALVKTDVHLFAERKRNKSTEAGGTLCVSKARRASEAGLRVARSAPCRRTRTGKWRALTAKLRWSRAIRSQGACSSVRLAVPLASGSQRHWPAKRVCFQPLLLLSVTPVVALRLIRLTTLAMSCYILLLQLLWSRTVHVLGHLPGWYTCVIRTTFNASTVMHSWNMWHCVGATRATVNFSHKRMQEITGNFRL